MIRKPERKRPLGRQRRRWFDNIKIDFVDVEWGGVPQDRDNWRALLNATINLRVL
jgi:hypothetical protein